MLHLDIKGSNILLGDAAETLEQSLTNEYPSIRVSDFGLAEISGPSDDVNPEKYFWKGTTGFRPPVS